MRTSGTSDDARPVEIDDRVLLIRIPRLYRHGMSDVALYEATRGHWRIGPRRELADYAFAVHQGVVLEVYAFERWQPAGTTPSATRPGPDDQARWEFVGRPAPQDIRAKYVGRSVKAYFKQGHRSPVVYVNC